MNDIKSKLSGYTGLPRSIYILFIIRIVNAMGNFVYPFLTLYLIKRLGFSAGDAGKYFLISACASSMGSLLGGKLADRYGRKKLMMIFQGSAALCFIGCAFFNNSIWVPVLLIMASFCSSAAQPANSAMVTDLTNKDNRKQAFSLLYLGINIGFTFGPMLAGFLYNTHTVWIFFGNATSIFISLTLMGLFVKETIPSKEEISASLAEANNDEAAAKGSTLKALLSKPTLVFFLIGRTINHFVYATIGFAIPLQMAKNFGDAAGPQYYGYLMSFTGIVVLAFTIPVIHVTGKIKPIMNLAFAGVFYAVGFGMLGFVNHFALYLVSGLLFTIGEVLEVTNSGVYIANHSPINHRARFNAIIPLITGSGMAIGPYVFGHFIDAYGLKRLWIGCFVLAMLSGAFMVWLSFYEDRIKEKAVENCREAEIA